MAKRIQKIDSPLDRLREIIRAWPETDERISHGAPTWWGGKKTFATLRDNHHGDGAETIAAEAAPVYSRPISDSSAWNKAMTMTMTMEKKS